MIRRRQHTVVHSTLSTRNCGLGERKLEPFATTRTTRGSPTAGLPLIENTWRTLTFIHVTTLAHIALAFCTLFNGLCN
ncbi:hypothetical protein ACET3X_004067 [Alternaria dauci]|uniref:Uncharacterized protein n=1 Tax=Alternaria dauci TaxID=48095 RepID=A0ABR3ULU3_9PLEO